ncbi:MAG: MBL fold metallo-hydrolase [Desulfobacterales bacterium]|jgi:glyoxylase-like metal-dependent hydrolase (beta-lactamase superfamily II)
MQPVEIIKDLFFIERGFLNGNHFAFRSEKPILIDTAYIADFDRTADLITQLGIKLSDVQLIISTHCHCDHIGGNKRIQDQSGCDVALHKIGKYFIDTRNDWATWWKYYAQEAEFFDCTMALNDGDAISIGSHEFKVIHTPGHAAEGIVLYNRKEKLLISSDTLWKNDMAVMTLQIEGSAAPFQMLASLEKLAELDVQLVYPGHGPPFRDIHKALTKTQKRLHHFLNHRDQMGLDLLKKISIYTLMMRKNVAEKLFFDELMKTRWYKETVDLYFNAEYRSVYDAIMKVFLKRGIVKTKNGRLSTTIRP